MIRSLLDLFFPRQCLLCGCSLSVQEDVLCVACHFGLSRTGYHLAEHSFVESSFWGKIPVERVVAYFYYNATTRQIVFDMKYHNRPRVGTKMGRMMAREIMAESDFFSTIDVIVPVPLHRNRLRSRGYNQCSYLAEGIRKETGIPVVEDAVLRVVDNESQTRVRRENRESNAKGIFRCVRPEKLRGKHVLIVDDVVTTGSTMLSCAEAIMQAAGSFRPDGLNVGGDIRFSILSLAHAARVQVPMSEVTSFRYADEDIVE